MSAKAGARETLEGRCWWEGEAGCPTSSCPDPLSFPVLWRLCSAISWLHASRPFPLGKEGKDLLSVTVTCHLTSTNSLRSGMFLLLCKCEINLWSEISSLRSKLVRFISYLIKLRVPTKMITFTWVRVDLPVLVDRARKFPGL